MLDEYVYCTKCKNFKLNNKIDEETVCPAECDFENDCYFWDWEDGRRMELRKHYEPIE